MSAPPDRFVADLELRNDARALLKKDLAHARQSITSSSVTDRIARRMGGRINAGAKDAVSLVKAEASANKPAIAVVTILLTLWFARSAIFEWLGFQIAEAQHDRPAGCETGSVDEVTPVDEVGRPSDREMRGEPANPAAT